MNTKLPDYTINYSGRLVDLELLTGVTVPEDIVKVDIATDTTAPKLVTGVQKAVQQYVNLLLSELGTKRFEPNVGGTIFSSIQRGRINSKGYMAHVFNEANFNALSVLKSDLASISYEQVPADERILTVDLINIDLDFQTASIRLDLDITTEAGNKYTYIVPVSNSINI